MAAELAVRDLVVEYLKYNGFQSTAQAFKEDTSSFDRRRSLVGDNVSVSQSKDQILADMMRLFDAGEGDSFFALWEINLPHQVRKESLESKQLHFYSTVRFAICNGAKTVSGNDPSWSFRMQQLKSYIDTHGDQLAAIPELLPFFALPFSQQPQHNPTFAKLFDANWVPDLRHKVEMFLARMLQPAPLPALYKLQQSDAAQGPTAGTGDHARTMKACELLLNLCGECIGLLIGVAESTPIVDGAEVASKKYRLQGLRADLGFAGDAVPSVADLTDAVHSWIGQSQASRADSVPPPSNDKPASSPKPLGGSPEQEAEVSGSTFSKTKMLAIDSREAADAAVAAFGRGEPVALDYDKIKAELLSAQPMRRCLILQALRWRLTQCSVMRTRRKAITQYIKFDVLGVMEDQGHKRVMHLLMRHQHSGVVEQILRLCNTLASDASGRTYLLDADGIVPLLCNVLRTIPNDTPARQNVLGILQKFSLRRSPQDQMIQCGVIQWALQALRDTDMLSDYTLEYAAALLMNLSLRTQGKNVCESPSLRTLETLADLLEHDNMQVRTYINGTLYSLLSRAQLKESAHAMGLSDILTCLANVLDDSLRRQLQYIEEQLHAEPMDDGDSDAEGDEEEDQDGFDDEEEIEPADEDEALSFPGASTARSGEALLGAEFAAVRIGAPAALDLSSVGQAVKLEPKQAASPQQSARRRASGAAPLVPGSPGSSRLRSSMTRSIMPSGSRPSSSAGRPPSSKGLSSRPTSRSGPTNSDVAPISSRRRTPSSPQSRSGRRTTGHDGAGDAGSFRNSMPSTSDVTTAGAEAFDQPMESVGLSSSRPGSSASSVYTSRPQSGVSTGRGPASRPSSSRSSKPILPDTTSHSRPGTGGSSASGNM